MGSRFQLSAHLFDSTAHQLVLLLKALVLTLDHSLVVRVGACQISLVLQALVEHSNGVLLCLNLAAIVVNHIVALVLQSLVLSLSLHQLSLKLLELL